MTIISIKGRGNVEFHIPEKIKTFKRAKVHFWMISKEAFLIHFFNYLFLHLLSGLRTLIFYYTTFKRWMKINIENQITKTIKMVSSPTFTYRNIKTIKAKGTRQLNSILIENQAYKPSFLLPHNILKVCLHLTIIIIIIVSGKLTGSVIEQWLSLAHNLKQRAHNETKCTNVHG